MAKKRILVADDEPAVLEITNRMLEHLGYEGETRSKGDEALERFLSETEGIDLVITDIRMPGMDGVELARRVLETRPDMPVIFFSGCLESWDAERQRAGGVCAVLSKPVRLLELKAAVQSALDPEGNSGPTC